MYSNLDKAASARIKRCKKISDKIENLFAETLTKIGFLVKKTSQKQDKQHKDFWITDNSCRICKKPTQFSVDVKNERRNWDKEPCHSLEFKKFGHDGWSLVTNGPDMFAFETKNSFLMIWTYVIRNETLKIMRDLKAAGVHMKKDAKHYHETNEYKQYLVQNNNRGNNYYCLISREHAKKMSFMEIPK